MFVGTFAELREQLFPLYFAGKFVEAYDLITEAEPDFPERAENTLYWRACLACRIGNNELALDLLREMLHKGHWYSPAMLLRDEDLQPLHGNPAFDAILEANRTQYEAAHAESRPQRDVLPLPDAAPPYPLLLAMHGNNGTLAATTQWGYARDQGFLVALAQSSQIVSSKTYNWDDWGLAAGEIQQHITELQAERAIDPARILLGGFSMSGGLAAWLALSGAVQARGFISVGPFAYDVLRFRDLFAAGKQRRVRGSIVVGDRDTQCVAIAQEIHDLMCANGLACELEIVPELGHDFPPDWGQHLPKALAFIYGTE